VVRAAYEKLTKLNRAALRSLVNDQPVSADEKLYLKFELSGFRIGPIREILGAQESKLKTGYDGDVIQVTRSVNTLNHGPEFVSYTARWTKGQYASIYDRNWTVADIFNFTPGEYYDVGTYALYDVTVFFEGKTRAYRALALFHNPYGSVAKLRPTFWDTVVGFGGSLTEAWNESRPAVGEKESTPGDAATSPAVGLTFSSAAKSSSHHASVLRRRSPAPRLEDVPTYTSESYATTESTTGVPLSKTEDLRDHYEGAHGEQISFSGSCTGLGDYQYCKVSMAFLYTYENGRINTWLYVHRNREADKDETATGPRGIPISCDHGHGIATRYCLDPNCTFSASLQGSGGSMQMTGGDVWNGQLVHKHTCLLPKTSTNCSNSWAMQKCFSVGEDWDPSTCSCSAATPVVIDINGDGFALTDKAGGVNFDINGDGQPDQIGWTAATADDAWLGLDRNGNGVIDNGRELFGNATPQPASAAPNGFLALAEYDSVTKGGNGDGWIDSQDSVYTALRLWRDSNHNGISEAAELHPLSEFGVTSLDLNFKDSQQSDEFGNRFRYRAKVRNVQGEAVGRWAWDVFLVH
jgi:hypothetical protein